MGLEAMIACPKCGERSGVYASVNEGTFVRRWRACPGCDFRFRSYESALDIEPVKAHLNPRRLTQKNGKERKCAPS